MNGFAYLYAPSRSCWNLTRMKVISQSDLFSSALSGNFKPWMNAEKNKRRRCFCLPWQHNLTAVLSLKIWSEERNIFKLYMQKILCELLRCAFKCKETNKKKESWESKQSFPKPDHWQTLAVWPARGLGLISPAEEGSWGRARTFRVSLSVQPAQCSLSLSCSLSLPLFFL